MKLAYVSASSIPSRTANSIHVMKMSQAFHDQGIDVTLLAPGSGPGEDQGFASLARQYGVAGGFSLHRYRAFKGPARTLFTTLSILKALRRIKPDLVYGRYAPACAAACLAGFPVAFEAHSPLWREGPITRASMAVMRRSPVFRKLVVISEALKRMCIEAGGFRESDILVAHDGADEQAVPDGLSKEGIRLRAGYFGHLYKGRGIELILQVAERLTDVDFHIYGGNEEDIRYWKGEAKGTNLFFHGFVEPGEVPGYRQSCDILLAPYQKKVAISGGSGDTSSYMSPLKIFEYMSQNRPIVVSDLPVLREVLDEKKAVLVDPEDPAEWVRGIDGLRDASLRQRLAGAAYREFLEHYTWKGRARGILEILGIDPRYGQ